MITTYSNQAANGNLGTSFNWSNGIPGPNDTAIITSEATTGSVTAKIIDLNGTASFTGVSFTASTSIVLAGTAITIQGCVLTGPITGSAGFQLISTGNTYNSATDFSAGSVASTGDTFNGHLTVEYGEYTFGAGTVLNGGLTVDPTDAMPPESVVQNGYVYNNGHLTGMFGPATSPQGIAVRGNLMVGTASAMELSVTGALIRLNCLELFLNGAWMSAPSGTYAAVSLTDSAGNAVPNATGLNMAGINNNFSQVLPDNVSLTADCVYHVTVTVTYGTATAQISDKFRANLNTGSATPY